MLLHMVFSSCVQWWLFFIAVRLDGGKLLIAVASLVSEDGLLGAWASELWLTGLVAPWYVGSSQTRDRVNVPCIARWILNHWTTRAALLTLILK